MKWQVFKLLRVTIMCYRVERNILVLFSKKRYVQSITCKSTGL